MKKILVERGEVQKLATLFSVTSQTVRNALKYITEGEIPERIRDEAKKRGGVIVRRKLKI